MKVGQKDHLEGQDDPSRRPSRARARISLLRRYWLQRKRPFAVGGRGLDAGEEQRHGFLEVAVLVREDAAHPVPLLEDDRRVEEAEVDGECQHTPPGIRGDGDADAEDEVADVKRVAAVPVRPRHGQGLSPCGCGRPPRPGSPVRSRRRRRPIRRERTVGAAATHDRQEGQRARADPPAIERPHQLGVRHGRPALPRSGRRLRRP